MAKADSTALNKLHELIAIKLTNIIENGIDVVTKDGDVIKVDAPASYIASAIKFLKDNDITAGLGNRDVSELERAIEEMNNLPFEDEVPQEFMQ